MSPMKDITTSLKQLFVVVIFLIRDTEVWPQGKQTTKSDELPSDNSSDFHAPAGRIKWWKRRGRVGSSSAFKQEAPGKVTAGHWWPDTHSEMCASTSRHSRKRSGPYGILDVATRGGARMPPLSISVLKQSCAPCTYGQTFSPHCCCALERWQFWASFLTHNSTKISASYPSAFTNHKRSSFMIKIPTLNLRDHTLINCKWCMKWEILAQCSEN